MDSSNIFYSIIGLLLIIWVITWIMVPFYIHKIKETALDCDVTLTRIDKRLKKLAELLETQPIKVSWTESQQTQSDNYQ